MKYILTILGLTFGLNLYSQQFEIGPAIGYWSDNIADYNSESDRAVIGKGLWNPNFGISAIYYFRKPDEILTGRIVFLYRNTKRGSVSEVSKNDKIEFYTNVFGLIGSIARDIGQGYILYFDMGFSYNTFDNSSIYEGNWSQVQSFPKLKEELKIKPSGVGFLYAMGVEKMVGQNLKLFFEGYGDAGISKINKTKGSFRTQALGFGMGIRYVFDLAKE